jgi:hypothetical protein
MQREARYDPACQQGKDEQVYIKSKGGYRILNDIWKSEDKVKKIIYFFMYRLYYTR